MDSSFNIDVAALDADHRRAMEDVLGRPLAADERLIIQIAPAEAINDDKDAPPVLDLLTHFYDGFTEQEIDEIDQTIKTRATLTR